MMRFSGKAPWPRWSWCFTRVQTVVTLSVSTGLSLSFNPSNMGNVELHFLGIGNMLLLLLLYGY